MNFEFSLAITYQNFKGNQININYYDNNKLVDNFYTFIVNSLKNLIEMNIYTSVCYCIGSGKNYEFLLRVNKEHNLFDKIIPLEHPRFIMQYNSNNKELYLKNIYGLLNTNIVNIYSKSKFFQNKCSKNARKMQMGFLGGFKYG